MNLHKSTGTEYTLVRNQFIDQYMVSANGEFVKVYLYLLRCSCAGCEITLTAIADALNHTEKDVNRALLYWEKLNLLHLTYDQAGILTDISFGDGSSHREETSRRAEGYADAMKAKPAAPDPGDVKITISPERRQELSSREEVRQILYIAEQYLGRQLGSSEINHILYFYDELHFSADLIEYLIEYCVTRNKKSIHYIKKVALEWASKGVRTVEEARRDTNMYCREYYMVLNAFGIRDRGPARGEIEYMVKWFSELGFGTDIVLEACSRTINRIHTPSFPYTDTILQGWKDKGVHHVSDIDRLDPPPSPETAAKGGKSGKSSSFGFSGRDYDYDKLEQQLLDC